MFKFERILCATDFSKASLQCVQYCSSIVHQLGGSVTLLYVEEFEKSPYGYFAMNKTKIEEHRAEVEEFAKGKFMEEMKESNLKAGETAFLVRFGTAYHEIIAEAEHGGYSAAAIATQGLGCSSPHLIGRTAERIVRICRAPVITMRANGTKKEWRMKTILCPTDFSEYGNYALPYALSLARRFKSKLILLHVTDLNVSNPEKLISRFPDPSVYHQFAHEIKIEKLVGRDIEPENSIVQVTADYDVDMVIVGTHGARGLRRVQIGNTTEEIIRRVEVPVLSITHPIHSTVFPHRFTEEYRSAGIEAELE